MLQPAKLRNTTLARLVAVAALAGAAGMAHAADPVLMSPQWTRNFCQAWNQTPALADGLAGEWLHDDKGRGYKIIEMYRSDCGKKSMVELKIVPKDGKAHCAVGGAVSLPPDFGVDFLMYADTSNWESMGKGDPGPMWAMMSGKLQFQGPKMVAMRAIEPFKSFLLLVGKVSYDAKTCPSGAVQTSSAK